MYGLYNNAYTASVTDNGDIELAGTVTVTRDSGSTGSGMVYGIANSGSGSNTDGVIRVTGGAVTVTNAYYGIIAFTKGHAAAFADVVISGGTVNVTSTTSGSSGIISWNNGITISGGTVTAGTARQALWLADSDSANKTGLVKITGDAKVSLTSTNYKALIVDGDTSNTSTRVHQINLTSGGSVTVKSTSSDEIYYTYPVQGYFSLGSSTKITEGSFRSTPDGTNAGGGKLFQSDNSTNQVVVAYGTPAPNANFVYVNDHPFSEPTGLYYKNGDSDTGSDSTDYNAYYNPATGVLELKYYNSGCIIIGGSVESDITIKLVGDNVISSDSQYGIVHSNGGDITITADSDATLTINVTDNSDSAYGIACDIPGSHAGSSREITISGKAKVTVNATSTSSAFNDNAVGIFTGGKAAIVDDASFTAICKSSTLSGGLQSAAGIYGYSGVTINTTGKVDIDVSQCNGAYNYGIFGNSDKSYNRLEKVSDMTIKWKNGSSGAPVTPPTSFDSAAATHAINVDTTNCVATYRYGTPYTVTVNNGSCDAANRQYLEGDTVTVTADTVSGITFKKWSSADVTVASETNATTTFIMPGKDVTATANYNLFTTEPSFARTSDTQGTISFTLAATPDGAPKLVEKDSDTKVGNQSFYGSTLERSNTVTNTGTYAVPNGNYRIAVEYSGTWFYSDVFTVDYMGTPQATVDNTIVSGTTNQMLLTPVDVFIKLQSDTFQGVSTNDNVESWFTNLPAGLTAVIRNVGSDAKAVTVRINGTPTEVKNEAMAITIPGEKLASGAALTVTENADAKFNISAPTSAGIVPPIENKTVTVGTDVFVPWPEGATSYQRFEDSTQVGSGDKSGYPDGMYIPAKSSPTTKTYKFKVSFPGGWVESNEFTVTWTAAAYTVTVQNDGNGSGSATPVTAAAGTEITLSATANSGYHFKEWQVVSGSVTITGNKFTMPASDVTVKAIFEADASETYSVTINAGANMALASGNANQSGLSGAMTATVYTAADGYYFPTDYAVAAVNGITVTRNSYTQITVSGTPTANTTITLTPATAKTKEATPTATFDAQGPDFGNLMNWPTGMKYSVDGGVTWTENTSIYTGKAIYYVSADKDIKVYMPASDPNTKLDSDIQTIDVTKAATPTGVIGVACTTSANNDGKLQNVTAAMQYKKSDASSWTDCGGTEVTGLTPGTYYVRVKYSGTMLASDNQEVTVAAYSASMLADVNGDGQIDTVDLTIMRKYLSGYTVEMNAAAADLNGDGTIDTIDLTLMRKYLIGETGI